MSDMGARQGRGEDKVGVFAPAFHNAYYFWRRCLMLFVPPHTVNMNGIDDTQQETPDNCNWCVYAARQCQGV